MKIIAYQTNDALGWELDVAPKTRSWMDETPNQFAYRCLPMTIANQAGWVIRCPVSFSVRWNGRASHEKSLKFKFAEDAERYSNQILSNFGGGIVTFAIPWLFRTEPGVSLTARGLPNEPKFNCTPLEGVVETDWSPFTFTMNWKIQLPWASVKFHKGEPICFLQPSDLSLIESMVPVRKDIGEMPLLEQEHEEWAAERKNFNSCPHRNNDWQKHYFKGQRFRKRAKIETHRTKIAIQQFLASEDENGADGA